MEISLPCSRTSHFFERLNGWGRAGLGQLKGVSLRILHEGYGSVVLVLLLQDVSLEFDFCFTLVAVIVRVVEVLTHVPVFSLLHDLAYPERIIIPAPVRYYIELLCELLCLLQRLCSPCDFFFVLLLSLLS